MTNQIQNQAQSPLSLEPYPPYLQAREGQSAGKAGEAKTPASTVDQVSLKGSPISPLGLFFDQVTSSLNTPFKENNAHPLPAYSDSGDSAAGMAGKILNSIENQLFSSALQRQAESLQKAPTDSSPKSSPPEGALWQKFEAGLEKAFQTTMDHLTRQSKADAPPTDIYQANKLIQKGLKRLQKQAQVPVESYQESLHTHLLSESMHLNIKTQEGDQISIAFQQIDQSTQNQLQVNTAQYNAQGTAVTHYFSNDWAVVIQGDLNEDELAAIGDLVNDVNGLAEQFFSGDFQNALEDAMALGFNTDELAGFSLSLDRNEVDMTALASQTAVKNDTGQDALPQQKASKTAPRLPLMNMINATLTHLKNLADHPAIKTIRQPQKTIGDLFRMIGEQATQASNTGRHPNLHQVLRGDHPSTQLFNALMKAYQDQQSE